MNVSGDSTKRLDDIEKRLALVEARLQIEHTIFQYARALDYGPETDYADCYMPDGSYEIVYENGKREFAKGRDELIKYATELRKRISARSRHFVMAPDIHIDGDTATATALMGALSGLPNDAKLGLIGRYHDVFKKCPDGRWRFQSRLSDMLGRHKDMVAAIGGPEAPKS